MHTTGGFQDLAMWVVMIVGTAALWATVFLAVRALYIGRDTAGSPAPDPSRQADPLGERLATGEITLEEYEYLRAHEAVPGWPSPRPPHPEI